MAKTTILSVPSELPHASIYLDDLFEIERILYQYFSELPNSPTISFHYIIDETIRMTTHDDLISHGGESEDFSLIIETGKEYSSHEKVLIFYSSLNPSFSVPFQLNKYRWAVYAQIEQIFRARSKKLPTFLGLIPRPALYGLYGSFSMMGTFVVGALISLVLYSGFHKYWPYILIGTVVYLIVFIPIMVSVKTIERSDKIYLQFQRDSHKALESTRKEWFGKIVLLALGTIMGVLGTLLSNFFKH
jgi:hypothetical protein